MLHINENTDKFIFYKMRWVYTKIDMHNRQHCNSLQNFFTHITDTVRNSEEEFFFCSKFKEEQLLRDIVNRMQRHPITFNKNTLGPFTIECHKAIQGGQNGQSEQRWISPGTNQNVTGPKGGKTIVSKTRLV